MAEFAKLYSVPGRPDPTLPNAAGQHHPAADEMPMIKNPAMMPDAAGNTDSTASADPDSAGNTNAVVSTDPDCGVDPVINTDSIIRADPDSRTHPDGRTNPASDLQTDLPDPAASEAQQAASLPRIFAIAGPTGTGKTALSVQLAHLLDGEVISCDSMQVYRQMDIGTAKVTQEEMDGIPHHLLDIQEYNEPYNVKIFQEKCRAAVQDILSRGKVPILCGGTGLYMKAALYDYQFTEEKEDQFDAVLAPMSNEQLVDLLKEKDPQALEKIHPNNRKRLLRAASMALSGKSKTEREQAQNHQLLYDVYLIGLQAEKELVDSRIEKRAHAMFEQGLAEEVIRLFSDPKSWEFTSFQGIGYKEFKEYFEKRQTLEEVEQAIIVHSRQYAKRQMTWFRHQMDVHWYNLVNTQQILEDAKAWYES